MNEYVALKMRAFEKDWTKEHLLLEVADWQARSAHESKVAFREGRIYEGLVWGSKLDLLERLRDDVRKIAYEKGPEVVSKTQALLWATERLDPVGDLAVFFGGLVDIVLEPLVRELNLQKDW